MESTPCSRVYQVFYRPTNNGGRFPGHPGNRNKLRTAALWMDDFAPFVWAGPNKDLETDIALAGPLDERRALQRRLGCRPFSEFLAEAWPESEVSSPADLRVGTFQHGDSKLCLDTLGRVDLGTGVGPYGCNHGGSQRFVWLRNGWVMPLNKMEICLGPALKWVRCGAFVRGDKLKGAVWELRDGALRNGAKCVRTPRSGDKSIVLDECGGGEAGGWEFAPDAHFPA